MMVMATETDVKQFAQLPALCPVFNVRAASRLLTQLFDDTLKPSGLQITQLSILVGITTSENPTINQLAKILVMDRTTLTRGLKPLEKIGLIKIKKGNDRRTTLLEVTPKGLKAMYKALPYWKQARDRVADQYGEKFLDGLNKSLASVHQEKIC